jgi:DNA-binding transcriptional regulator GbsR (MarR family)
MPREDELHYVEKVGLYFEQLTLPRMAGRIFGWLLIAEQPMVTMNELIDVLQASKSSISSMTRLLIQINLVEVISLPGERRDYYRIRKDAWANTLKARITQAQNFRMLAEQGLEILTGSSQERCKRLEEMHSMYSFLERELPRLLEDWEQERPQ